VRLSARSAELIRGGLLYPGLHHQEEVILRTLAGEGALSLKQLEAAAGIGDAGQWIESLAARGWLELEEFLEKPRVREKTQLGIRSLAKQIEQSGMLTDTQRRLLAQLEASGSPRPLQAALRISRCSLSVARALERKGLVEMAPLEVNRLPIELSELSRRQELVFTNAQRLAFERLCALLERRAARRCLLHGVTGSGKTEIYLRLMAEVLRRGEGAMFLVPEIALTPLLSRMVATYFPDQVALLHSGMSAGERLDQWNRIRSGRARVVLGTRSAVFAPIEKLRLVVIDEEQDSSYKQDESPYYHAREVAWQRIQQSHGVLLMGSATPSIETHHASAETGDITLLTLPERIRARPLPEVAIVDMGLEFERHGRSTVISEVLQHELVQRLSRGEQSMVLLNRRGFSRSLLCRSCGHVFTCPDCSISMTYHQETGRLVCHYCATESDIPDACSSCGGTYIHYVGVGTEQLEQILRRMLPRARIARVDRDSTRRRGALRQILMEFEARNLDLLVGTQMLAKGHDFPNVTLVGVVGADVGLSFPDFRAAERTFQLLTQVAGRAGRGEVPGRVVIQTFYPNHYALLHARKQDYGGFYSREIEFRKLLGYPPFTRLIQILVSEKSPEKGARIAEKVASAIRLQRKKPEFRSDIQVLGPAPAPLEKLRGLYRFQILIKGTHGIGASAILREVFEQLGRHRVPIRNVHVDVDPLSML
jgi:primosomal protein N' (replication factor Y)